MPKHSNTTEKGTIRKKQKSNTGTLNKLQPAKQCPAAVKNENGLTFAKQQSLDLVAQWQMINYFDQMWH